MLIKKPYKVDLRAHGNLCDDNYLRLQRLLPSLEELEAVMFGVSFRGQKSGEVHIKVLDRSPYTTTLNFYRLSESPWLDTQSLAVRIYHDAASAEVLATSHGHQYEAKYPYPNSSMFHADEKLQANILLAEWLNYCLEFGHSLDEIKLA